MKRILLIFLCALLLAGAIMPAYAAERRASTTPTLSFDGTTANCYVSYRASGKSISLTLSLYQGSTLVDSWSASGTSRVSVSGSCQVTSGKSYTLKVSGTSGGSSISAQSVTKTCP